MPEVVAAPHPGQLWVWPTIGLLAGPAIAELTAEPVVAVTAVSVIGSVLTTVWLYLWWGRNAVLATDEGIVTRTRGTVTLEYRWSDIVSATWADGGWGWATFPLATGVLVCPAGGPYAVPGPNYSVQVGAVLPAMPWRRRAVANHAADVLERHLGDRFQR